MEFFLHEIKIKRLEKENERLKLEEDIFSHFGG